MKKGALFFLMGAFFVFLLISCNNDYETQKDTAINKVDSNFISLEKAKDIAADYEFINVKTRSKIGKKHIANVYSLKKKSDLPEMYIVNYEKGGFLIVSADNRVNNILAYSAENPFPIGDEMDVPLGVKEWMDEYICLIDSVRKYNITKLQNEHEKHFPKTKTEIPQGLPLGEWGACNNDGQSEVRYCYENRQDLKPYHYYVPGFTHTIWDQGVGYNNLLDNMGCGSYSNGRPPVGCVAVAMAQLMRFFEKPSSFDWDSMDPRQGSYATQVLMKDIGQKVKMIYDCSGSGAYDSDALAAFKQYGYKRAKFYDFRNGKDADGIWRQLIKGSPIYAAGSSSNGRHAFIIQGASYKYVFRCIIDKDQFISLHPFIDEAYYDISWGWGRNYCGLFLAGNFAPSGANYNLNMKFIGDLSL